MYRRLPPIAAAVATATAGTLPVFLTGALSVQIRQRLHFDETSLGAAVAVFFVAAALCSAVFGRLAEHVGPVRQMRAAAIASAVSCESIALFAHTWWQLPVLLSIGGLANGAGQPAANLLLARSVPVRSQGLAFGAKQAAIPLSTLLGGLAVPLVALTVGWRWAFVGAGCLAVAIAVLLPRAIEGGVGSRRSPAEAHSKPAKRSRTSRDTLGPLVVLAIAMALGSAAANSLGTFIVPSSVFDGIHPGQAGLLAALGSLAGLVTRVVAGIRADRRGRAHLRAVAIMVSIGAVGYLALAFGLTLLDVVATPLAFAAGWGWPGLFNLAVVRTHRHAPGWATGITQTGAYAGGAIGPALFGLVAQHASYATAWTLDAGLALAAAGGMLLGRKLVHAAR
ncbi:MAG: MFS transporter [Acidimicrobiales bacterium]